MPHNSEVLTEHNHRFIKRFRLEGNLKRSCPLSRVNLNARSDRSGSYPLEYFPKLDTPRSGSHGPGNLCQYCSYTHQRHSHSKSRLMIITFILMFHCVSNICKLPVFKNQEFMLVCKHSQLLYYLLGEIIQDVYMSLQDTDAGAQGGS